MKLDIMAGLQIKILYDFLIGSGPIFCQIDTGSDGHCWCDVYGLL